VARHAKLKIVETAFYSVTMHFLFGEPRKGVGKGTLFPWCRLPSVRVEAELSVRFRVKVEVCDIRDFLSKMTFFSFRKVVW